MPVIETTTRTLYKFDELSDEAKEKARDWYREGQLDYEWWDSIYDDAINMADLLGITIDRRHSMYLVKGVKRQSSEPKIWFSGFCSQGDGACWEGSYKYRKGALKAVQSEAPAGYKNPAGGWVECQGNKELHRIANALQEVQRKHFYKLVATSTQSGRYSHSGCMSVEVEHDDDRYRGIGDAEGEITTLLRDFADWIYNRLEEEHDWLRSDEQVDENIVANEYMFTEDGGIA